VIQALYSEKPQHHVVHAHQCKGTSSRSSSISPISEVFRFRIEGLQFQWRHSPLHWYTPLFRYYSDEPVQEVSTFLGSSFSKDCIQHMDIITTWKGLHASQANELTFWGNAFRACLEDVVEEFVLMHFYYAFPPGFLGMKLSTLSLSHFLADCFGCESR
jgi:hypothetical protein